LYIRGARFEILSLSHSCVLVLSLCFVLVAEDAQDDGPYKYM
jgi:hypothetical protein